MTPDDAASAEEVEAGSPVDEGSGVVVELAAVR